MAKAKKKTAPAKGKSKAEQKEQLPYQPRTQPEKLYILAYKFPITGKFFGYRWKGGLLHGGVPCDAETVARIRGSGGTFYWWEVVKGMSITYDEPGLGPRAYAG